MAVEIVNDSAISEQKIVIQGPAVTALDGRKEDNNHTHLTHSKLKKNLARVSPGLMANLKKLSSYSA